MKMQDAWGKYELHNWLTLIFILLKPNQSVYFFLLSGQDAEIVRSRDPAVLAECDVVVDVGGEFDPKRHRYDHHQRY